MSRTIDNYSYLNRLQVIGGIKNTSEIDSVKYILTKKELKSMFKVRVTESDIEPIRVLLDDYGQTYTGSVIDHCSALIDKIGFLNDNTKEVKNYGEDVLYKLAFNDPIGAIETILINKDFRKRLSASQIKWRNDKEFRDKHQIKNKSCIKKTSAKKESTPKIAWSAPITLDRQMLTINMDSSVNCIYIKRLSGIVSFQEPSYTNPIDNSVVLAPAIKLGKTVIRIIGVKLLCGFVINASKGIAQVSLGKINIKF